MVKNKLNPKIWTWPTSSPKYFTTHNIHIRTENLMSPSQGECRFQWVIQYWLCKWNEITYCVFPGELSGFEFKKWKIHHISSFWNPRHASEWKWCKILFWISRFYNAHSHPPRNCPYWGVKASFCRMFLYSWNEKGKSLDPFWISQGYSTPQTWWDTG